MRLFEFKIGLSFDLRREVAHSLTDYVMYFVSYIQDNLRPETADADRPRCDAMGLRARCRSGLN